MPLRARNDPRPTENRYPAWRWSVPRDGAAGWVRILAEGSLRASAVAIVVCIAPDFAGAERAPPPPVHRVDCSQALRRQPMKALPAAWHGETTPGRARSHRAAAAEAPRRPSPRYWLNKNSRPDVQQIPCHAVPRPSGRTYELMPASGSRRAQPPEWLFESPAADGVSSYDQFGIPIFKGVPPIVILKPDRRK